MKNLLWLLLFPALAFAQRPASLEMHKDPIYIEVQPQEIVIYPEKSRVAAAAIEKQGNLFLRLLDQAQAVGKSHYIVLILRPGSTEIHRQLRQMIQAKNLGIGFEPLEAGTDVQDDSNSIQNPANVPTSGIEFFDSNLVDRIWIRRVGTPIEVPANGRAPFYLECRGNRLFAIADDAPAKEFEISEMKDLDPAAQYVCLLVRPDSFEIFRKARKAAWEHGLDVSCELQNESGPFAIGPEGTPPLFPKPESPAPIRSPKTQDLLDRADAFLSKAEAFSIHPFISSNQSPVHVEIWPERIAISPEMSGLVATGDPEKDFESLFGRMEDMRETHYFVLIPHPGGAIFQRRLRQQLKERGIDVVVQLPETHFEAASRTIMDFHGALPPRPASETRNEPPCDIEVRSNAITILPDRNVVTLDELRVSGNAFERLLDRFEAQGECPNVQLCEMPGGEKLKSQLGGQIFLAAKSMGCQMKIEALFPETDLPDGKRDRPTAGAAGFECRHGLLYDLSDPASAGHTVRFRDPEDSRWLDAKLAAVVSANKSIRFYVRPDGFEPYRNARMMAWILGIPFSKTVLNENEPLPAID